MVNLRCISTDDFDDDAEVDAEYEYRIDDERVSRAANAGRERRHLAKRERDLRLATVEAVRELHDSGYSVRDAAALLEVTPGRVSQLT